MVDDDPAAAVERDLVALREPEAVAATGRGRDADARVVVRSAAAAWNAGRHRQAVALAERAVTAVDLLSDRELYTAAWVLVSDAGWSAPQLGTVLGRLDQTDASTGLASALRMKIAMRDRNAEALGELTSTLEAAGLEDAAKLARADAAFLRKDWARAAAAYQDLHGSRHGLLGIQERRAYALYRDRRLDEARAVLADLPVRSAVAMAMRSQERRWLARTFVSTYDGVTVAVAAVACLIVVSAALAVAVGAYSRGSTTAALLVLGGALIAVPAVWRAVFSAAGSGSLERMQRARGLRALKVEETLRDGIAELGSRL